MKKYIALCLITVLLASIVGVAEDIFADEGMILEEEILGDVSIPEQDVNLVEETISIDLGDLEIQEAPENAAPVTVLNLAVSERYTVDLAALTDRFGLDENTQLVFNSSAPEIAEVNSEGVITALRTGEADINCLVEQETVAIYVVKVGEKADGEPAGEEEMPEQPAQVDEEPAMDPIEETLAVITDEEEHSQVLEDEQAEESTPVTRTGSIDGCYIVDGELVQYTGEGGAVTIPAGVTRISNHAFAYNDRVTSVAVPEGVISIDDEAFKECEKLESIALPDSLVSIGEAAFYRCYALKAVVIPKGVTTIGNEAFSSCEALTSVEILGDVKEIGFATFSLCYALTDVILPKSLTDLGEWAFYGCNSLEHIEIPENVGSIGKEAFHFCDKLKDVTMHDKVTHIGDMAFCLCTSLTDITIPESVVSIGDSAFFQCIKLKSVTMHDKLTTIGEWAFQNCSSLVSITLSKNLTSIGEETFSYCSSLESITIPKRVTEIGESAFYGCSALKSVTMYDSVASIGEWAFSECSSLESVTMPDSVTSVGEGAFSYCSQLKSMKLSDKLTGIGEKVLSHCIVLASINIPESCTSIGKEAFSVCASLQSITIPRSVTSIGDKAFTNCDGLESITIPRSVTSIGDEAFSFCHGLKSITIPRSVTSVGENAFLLCEYLTIHCYRDSYIETYASINSIHFEIIPLPEYSGPKKLTLGVKETYALGMAGVSFESSNKAVATVDKKGVIAAKKTGGATVTISFDGEKVATCKVTVVKAPTKVSFDEKSVTLGVKETLALKPAITKGSHTSYTWTVKNKKIATVDKDGVVTGKKAGKTTVTVKTHNGKKATVTVKVEKAPGKVTLNLETVTLGVKETATLKPSIAKGSHTKFTWSTADKRIATVNQTGMITGKKAGITTVAVKTHNDKEALVTVIVKKAPSKVTISELKANVQRGNTIQLIATLPENTASQFTWKSSKPKVATVDNDGVVTALGIGTTKITVKTFNKKVATCVLKVTKGPLDDYVIKKGVITRYKGKGKEIVIPSSDTEGNPITAIGKAAFKGNKRITRVTIPSSITKIGANAFMNCTKLESVTYPSGIKSMGNGAFQNCKKLKNITVE